MIQNISSATPLEKVDYHLRDDGLADIRIRRSIRTVTHEATDNQPEYVEYTAIESYQILPLMEQEAIEQADSLFAGDATSSRPVLDRVTALEQASLDNAQLLADLTGIRRIPPIPTPARPTKRTLPTIPPTTRTRSENNG